MLAVLFCRGLPSQAFEYIMYNKGLMGEDAYPYRAEVLPGRRVCVCSGGCRGGSGTDRFPSVQNGTCKFQPDKAIAFVKDVINITQVSP